MLGLLVEQLFLMSEATGTTNETTAFRELVGQKSSEVAGQFPSNLHRLVQVLDGAAPQFVFRMVVETLAGKQWYYEHEGKCMANYLWDSSTLAKARRQFERVSIDPSGAKISGSYLRMAIAWSFVAVGMGISFAAGIANWGGRTGKFERINDSFQTFLLFLAVPAFTIKIMSHSGEQAIKDWLTGCVRIVNLEQIEKIVLNRLVRRHGIPGARAVLAINRVKCETDRRYNWTSPDNLCYKPGHKDGQISAMKARSAADLECVIGIDGDAARSWIAPSTTSYIYGADMNHLTFSCGGGEGPELKGLFVAQYPLHGAFFA